MKRLAMGVMVAVVAVCSTARVLRSSDLEEPGLKSLAADRVKIAKRAFAGTEEEFSQVTRREEALDLLPNMINWSRRWLEAEWDLAESREGRVRAVRDHVARLERWVEPMRKMAIGGARTGVSQSEVDLIQYYVLEAKARLIKEQRAAR